MRVLSDKWRYTIRAIAIVMLGAVGVQSCNVAMYNAWQTAFSANAPYLSDLSLRFWLFGLAAVAAFGCAIALLVTTIKRMNREYREEIEGDKGSGAN